MPKWVPGQSGNINGRPKRKTVEDEVKFRLARCRGRDRKEIAEALLECARAKRPWALKLVVDLDALRAKPADPAPHVDTGIPETLTRDRVQEQLLELLANPEVRRNLTEAIRAAELAVQ